jgi:hypothetical protein
MRAQLTKLKIKGNTKIQKKGPDIPCNKDDNNADTLIKRSIDISENNDIMPFNCNMTHHSPKKIETLELFIYYLCLAILNILTFEGVRVPHLLR